MNLNPEISVFVWSEKDPLLSAIELTDNTFDFGMGAMALKILGISIMFVSFGLIT